MTNYNTVEKSFIDWLELFGIYHEGPLRPSEYVRYRDSAYGYEFHSDATSGHVYNHRTNKREPWEHHPPRRKKASDNATKTPGRGSFSFEEATVKDSTEDKHLKAAAKAKQIVEACGEPDRWGHLYAADKKIKITFLVNDNNNIVIPCYKDGEIVSVQRINEDGDKLFLKNGNTKDVYYVIGDESAETITVAEGWATGACIHQATGETVFATFTADNLGNFTPPDHVKAVRIAVDNDLPNKRYKKGTGQTKAIGLEKRLKELGIKCDQLLPKHTKTDWADYNDLEIKEAWDRVALSSKLASQLSFSPPKPDLTYVAKPYLLKSSVVGFFGRGGSAKSSFVATLCAQASSKHSTLWITSEEDPNHVTTRINEIKGNDKQTTLTTSNVSDDGTRFTIEDNLLEYVQQAKLMFKQAESSPLGIVVLDTAVDLADFSRDKGTSSNDDASVKKLMSHLRHIATSEEVSVVIIGHLNKSKADHAADRVNGAAAWTASPRFAFMMEGSATEDNVGVIALFKTNLVQPFAAKYKTVPVWQDMNEEDERARVTLVKADEDLSSRVYGKPAAEALFAEVIKKDNEREYSRDQEINRLALAVKKVLVRIRKEHAKRKDKNAKLEPVSRKNIQDQMVDDPITNKQWKDIDSWLVNEKVAITDGLKGKKMYHYMGQTADL